MYRRCGSMDESRAAFESMPRKDVVSWNAIISGYAQSGLGREALDLYRRMDTQGIEPNRVTLLAILGAWVSWPRDDRSIPGSRRDLDFSLEAARLTMYARCGSLREAEEVFFRIKRRNVVCWTAMITAYAQAGHLHKAVEIYKAMDVEPNKITFVAALTAVSSLGIFVSGKRSMRGSELRRSNPMARWECLDHDVCSMREDRSSVFEGIDRKDAITWTSMITAYTHSGRASEALEVYEKMDVEANSVTCVSVLSACSVLGDLDQGRRIHSRIASFDLDRIDAAVGTALISMYLRHLTGSEKNLRADGIEDERSSLLLGAYAHFGGKDDSNEALGRWRTKVSAATR